MYFRLVVSRRLVFLVKKDLLCVVANRFTFSDFMNVFAVYFNSYAQYDFR